MPGDTANTRRDDMDSLLPDRPAQELYSDEELRGLAEDIIRHCPSLTQLLLAMGSSLKSNPLHGRN